MRNNIFTVFAREQRPLSYLLRQDARELTRRAASASSLADLEDFEGERLLETIASIRRVPPTLGQQFPGRSGDGEYRDVGDGTRVPTTRFFLDFEVLGDDEVLEWWPDETDDQLRPVNQDLMDQIGDERTASDEDARRYYASIDWWTSRPIRDPQGRPAVLLTTWADLANDEIADAAKRESLANLLRQRHADATKILDAIRTQMSTFYERELPQALREHASVRRAHLSDVQAVYRTLGLPTEWKMAPPKVEEIHDPPVVKLEGPEDLAVPIRLRLEPLSYADIQRTIRVWADKVEDHPEAFSGLIEDRISDLLCATLHATTSGAGREVFSRGGKADIRIQASALEEGSGPAPIFLLEAKWVGRREDVESAIEDQLMRYVPVTATSTVFLALSRNSDFARTVENVRSWARGVAGFTGEREGDVKEWPIFTYEIAELGDLPLDVCIATVAVPPVPSTRAAKATAAQHTTTNETEE